MANNRRGGIGFGGRDGGYGDDWDDDDDEVEATRAMEIVDDEMPPPTRTAPSPSHRPPGHPMPDRPSSRPRAVEFADTMADDEGDDEATRMLDAVGLAAEGFGAPAPPPPEPRGTRMELRVISGSDRGKHHNIPSGDHLVGRGLDCQIVLADPAVSRKHFRVVRSGDVVEAIDMGGANGTNLNGSRVSRQRLKPGDQLEVGTTVLEFWVDGAAAQRAGFAPAVHAPPDRATAAEGGERRLGTIIGLVAAGVLVLVGGGLGAYFMMAGGDKPAKEADEAPSEDEQITKLLKEGKELIEDHEWGEAVDVLKKAKKLAPDDAEIKGLLAKALDEVDYSETLDDGRASLKDKHYEDAIAKFGEVPNTSEQFTDARELLAEAREEFAGARLDDARKAMDVGEDDKAKKALEAILKVMPKHSEAKLMLAGLEGEEAGSDKGGDKGGAKGGERRGPGHGATAPRATGQSAKSLVSTGLKAYHNRGWSDAQRAFSQVADGRAYAKKDRNRARAYASAVRSVAGAFAAAESGSSPLKRAKAYKKAYYADRHIDGHFGPALVRKLAAAYVAAGKAFYRGHRYPAAADAVREAMNFDPENREAMQLEQKCIQQAGRLLQKAKEHMKKANYATARDYASRVTRILPGMDPRAAEARDIQKKASEASVQGDDD